MPSGPGSAPGLFLLHNHPDPVIEQLLGSHLNLKNAFPFGVKRYYT